MVLTAARQGPWQRGTSLQEGRPETYSVINECIVFLLEGGKVCGVRNEGRERGSEVLGGRLAALNRRLGKPQGEGEIAAQTWKR